MRRAGILLVVSIIIVSLCSCVMYEKYPKTQVNVPSIMESYTPESLNSLSNCIAYQVPWTAHPIYGSWIKFLNLDTLKVVKTIPLQGIRTNSIRSLPDHMNYYYYDAAWLSPKSTSKKGIGLLDKSTGNLDVNTVFNYLPKVYNDGTIILNDITSSNYSFNIYKPPLFEKKLLFSIPITEYIKSYSDFAKNDKYVYLKQSNSDNTISIKRYNLAETKLESVHLFDDRVRYDYNLSAEISDDFSYGIVLKYDKLSESEIKENKKNCIYYLDLNSSAEDKLSKTLDVPPYSEFTSVPPTELATKEYRYNYLANKNNDVYILGSCSGYTKENKQISTINLFKINTTDGSYKRLFQTDKSIYYSEKYGTKMIFSEWTSSKKYLNIYDISSEKFLAENFDIAEVMK